jgi:PAS domain S-box-containing protein
MDRLPDENSRRAHTDASLGAERGSADATRSRMAESAQRVEDALIVSDRIADERLSKFRENADAVLADGRSASPTPSDAVAFERNVADRGKNAERADADAILGLERQRAGAAVQAENREREAERARFDRRRQETDDQLSTERAHADAAARREAAGNVALREMNETLREMTETLSAILNGIGDGVIVCDVAGTVVRMNSVAEALTGWASADAAGRALADIFKIVDASTRAIAESPVDRALSQGTVVGLERPVILVRRNLSELPIDQSCAPLRRAAGFVTGAVLVIRDMTAAHKAKAIHEETQHRLAVAERMASIGTLAAGVAHEINNPLCYVTANLDMVLEEVRALSGGSSSGRMAELEEMLLQARQGAERVRKIVRGLKTFARDEAERRAVIAVAPVLELAINMAFNEIRHRARLVRKFGETPLIEADDARLGQVFVNLLVNAAQALPEGRSEANEICIVACTDHLGRAVVEFRDSGPGIPASVIERIFDPFFTTKPVGVGTGLGLSICKNIVNGMGGEISVESEEGHSRVP